MSYSYEDYLRLLEHMRRKVKPQPVRLLVWDWQISLMVELASPEWRRCLPS